MKKLVAALVAVCVVFAGVIGYLTVKNHQLSRQTEPQESVAPAPVETTPETAETAEPTETASAVQSLDLDAIYALHTPDEIVATVGEHEVTWQEYFYWLAYYATDVQEYISAMQLYYGMSVNWTDPWVADGDESFLDYIQQATEETLRNFVGVESFLAENGVELNEESRAAMQEAIETERATYLGEDASDEDWAAYLAEAYLTPELYERFLGMNYLYQQGFADLYGENGESVSEDDALAWLEENGFLNANHILLLTRDMSSYEELDADTIAEKKAQAEALAAELQAIVDRDELLARFAELKAEYDEDSGKEYYPDGYIFASGEMVAEFENATKELALYQVSDPVKSDYGYHVILRLPLDADSVLDYSSAGEPLTARSQVANEEYAARADAAVEAAEFVYAEGFGRIDLKDYLVEYATE